jgi:hypothetical protein
MGDFALSHLSTLTNCSTTPEFTIIPGSSMQLGVLLTLGRFACSVRAHLVSTTLLATESDRIFSHLFGKSWNWIAPLCLKCRVAKRMRAACCAGAAVTHSVRSYVATDGRRLADVYGHLPGYWMHPSLVVATFEKNVTTWGGAQAQAAAAAAASADVRAV